MRKTCANTATSMKPITGRSSGTWISQNARLLVQPSIWAASIRSLGIDWSAARKMSAPNPIQAQTVIATIV